MRSIASSTQWRRLTVYAVAAVLSIADFTAGRQDSGTEAFQKWFARLSELGGDNGSLDGLRVSYRIDMLGMLPADKLAALRAEVANHPEHPEAPMLPVYERRMAGKDSYDFSVWRLKGMWRYNRNPAGNESEFTDRVWGDGTAWSMSKSSLVLLNPSTADKYPYGLPRVSSSFSNDLFFLLNGGLGAPVLHGVVLKPVVSGGSWQASSELRQGEDVLRVKASGTWNEVEEWGTVGRLSFARSMPGGRTASYEVQTFDWKLIPALKLGMAGRAEVVDSETGPDRRLTLLGTSRFSPSEFRALTTPPTMEGSDPVRGRVTFRSVADLTGNQLDLKRFDELGNEVERRRRVAVQSDGSSEERLRVFGWLVAATALLLMGGLWIRRRWERARPMQ